MGSDNSNKNDDIQGMTLAQVLSTVLALLAQENFNQHRIGQLYNYVVKNLLAEGAGYRNAQEYFAKHVKALSRATLALYGAVAADFNAAMCAQYGVVALSLLRPTRRRLTSLAMPPTWG